MVASKYFEFHHEKVLNYHHEFMQCQHTAPLHCDVITYDIIKAHVHEKSYAKLITGKLITGKLITARAL